MIFLRRFRTTSRTTRNAAIERCVGLSSPPRQQQRQARSGTGVEYIFVPDHNRTLLRPTDDVFAVVGKTRLGMTVSVLRVQSPFVFHCLRVIIHGAETQSIVVGGNEHGRAGVQTLLIVESVVVGR